MFKLIKTQGKGMILGVLLTLITIILSVPIFGNSYTQTITVTMNSINILVNGKQAHSDNIIYNGKTYVQLKDLATMLGKDMYWDQATKTASVNDKGTNYTPPVQPSPVKPSVQTPVKPVSTAKNGYYEYTYTDATYHGNFVNDKRDGYGVCYYNNGAIYDGYWSNGKWHGLGSLQYANGDLYEGNFSNGNRDDTNATFIYANGTKYVGQYTNNMQTGAGTKYYSNGIYTGEFVNELRHGYGVYEFENGAYYEGYWQNNKKHGQGTLYRADGTYDFGTWENDVLVSKG